MDMAQPSQQGNYDYMKNYLENVVSPSQLQEHRYREAKRKHEILLNKISFLDPPDSEEKKYKYNYEGVMPYLFFFKYLARKPFGNETKVNRLKLWLPDTIVINERGDVPPMWFYSSLDGYVYRTDYFNSKQIINKLSNYSSTDELVAVVKKVKSAFFRLF